MSGEVYTTTDLLKKECTSGKDIIERKSDSITMLIPNRLVYYISDSGGGTGKETRAGNQGCMFVCLCLWICNHASEKIRIVT